MKFEELLICAKRGGDNARQKFLEMYRPALGWSSKLVDWNNDLRTIGSLTLAEKPVQMKGLISL